MRRVPQRVPDLPAHRRSRVSIGVSGTDRINSQSESIRQRRGSPAVRIDAVRRVQGHLSGQDRYTANSSPFTLEGKYWRASAQVAARDRAGAARRAAIREDGALSADGSSDREIRGDHAETIRAQWLYAADAGTVRQLDEVSQLPAAAAA